MSEHENGHDEDEPRRVKVTDKRRVHLDPASESDAGAEPAPVPEPSEWTVRCAPRR